MSIRDLVKSDLTAILNTGGDDVAFRNIHTSRVYRTKGFINRRSQTFVPLTAISEQLPIHSVTIAKSGFSEFDMPEKLRDIEVSYIDINGEQQVFLVKEIREDYSNGRITFLLEIKLKDKK